MKLFNCVDNYTGDYSRSTGDDSQEEKAKKKQIP